MWVGLQQFLNTMRPGAARDRQFAVVILALWAFVTIRYWTGHWAPDLSALWFAARAVAQDMPNAIYAVQPDMFSQGSPAQWATLIAADGAQGHDIYPYVYPPLWAHVLAPVTRFLDPQRAFDIVLVIHVALISMGVMIAAKLARPDWMPRYGYALLCVVLLNTSTISTTALFQNQPQILVTFLVLLALERHLSGASRLAGCALALAAAIKVGPALLALIFLARGDRRALVWFLGIGASLAACSVFVAGWPAHQVFLHRLAQIDGVIALTQVNMAFDAVTYEIGTVFGWWPSPFAGAAYGLTIDQPKVIGLALRGVLILGAIALWRGQLRRPDRTTRWPDSSPCLSL